MSKVIEENLFVRENHLVKNENVIVEIFCKNHTNIE